MLYVRDQCPYGDKTEAYLNKIGAKFNRQNIKGKDPMFKTDDGRYGSVIVVVGNKTIRGFSERAINQAIESGGT